MAIAGMTPASCRAASATRTRKLGRAAWEAGCLSKLVETPMTIDAEAQRHLLANIELARELGAEVVRLKGRDPVAAILDFARSHGVGHIVVGRSRQPWWRRALGRSAAQRLLEEAREFDVQFIADSDAGDRR